MLQEVGVSSERSRGAVLTPHAATEAQRRGISIELVQQVLAAAEQEFEIQPGRVVLQARISMGDPAKIYLVRVFVDVDRQPPEVVTVYRTSKVEKYWRSES